MRTDSHESASLREAYIAYETGRFSQDMYRDDSGDRESCSTTDPAPRSAAPRSAAKVTARMLEIRELIDQGDYPDRDALAKRIVDANKS